MKGDNYKNPMDKNELGEPLPSRNQTVGETPELTTVAGAPVENNQDSMTSGRRGPLMLQDIWFLEKLAHFDREVIPERRMHAKGSGAFGTFTVTHDITNYTKAAIFSKVGKQTKMFARFSTVAGERGAADAERDIRGFALKFYTEEGNWDMVGNNTPVFFFRDPLKFPDLNHAIKRDPRTNMRSPNTNWDFWTSLPEALLQITIIMGDRGIPSSYRHMHGFSSHAYSLINKDNERVWVKFHFRSQQGIRNLTDQEAERVIGMDRESHQRDLYEAIEKGNFPKWKMYIQVMTEEQANSMKNNPFDLTKMWYKKDFPLIPVGEFELNKNPENYFADVEQAAFSPANVVPGISFSPDRMLQGRLFSYGDAQRYRLGVNHHQIPVNSPQGVKNYHSFHRDGKMRVDGNRGSQLNYEPNSYGNWKDQPQYALPVEKTGSIDILRYDFREDDNDYYTQPGELFRAMTPDQQQVLFENTARNMGDSTLQIKHRHIYNCYQADPKYGEGVAKALGIDISTVDLNLPERTSRQANYEANNKHPELNQPTEKKDSGREIDTNGDPYIEPENDPWLL
ncbi:MAG: catalase [Methanosarcina flavescens]|jgi:catalase|uniref:Catalase n=1 Tax=Methanosarcina flavescens TaxID=1715806 RepID=A0A660HNX5_9EURY|nr:catalase [Methanosarcina flavescens]AYK13963.1 catalase [Methanosarcina flavescens]NLK32717.1 catalase [Methanosarcina flavescens]